MTSRSGESRGYPLSGRRPRSSGRLDTYGGSRQLSSAEAPDLGDVRIVAVALSVDYLHARIHFVVTGTSAVEPRPAQRALGRAALFLRARLAEAIEMKRVPDLSFVFDGIQFAGDGGASCSE